MATRERKQSGFISKGSIYVNAPKQAPEDMKELIQQALDALIEAGAYLSISIVEPESLTVDENGRARLTGFMNKNKRPGKKDPDISICLSSPASNSKPSFKNRNFRQEKKSLSMSLKRRQEPKPIDEFDAEEDPFA